MAVQKNRICGLINVFFISPIDSAQKPIAHSGHGLDYDMIKRCCLFIWSSLAKLHFKAQIHPLRVLHISALSTDATRPKQKHHVRLTLYCRSGRSNNNNNNNLPKKTAGPTRILQWQTRGRYDVARKTFVSQKSSALTGEQKNRCFVRSTPEKTPNIL